MRVHILDQKLVAWSPHGAISLHVLFSVTMQFKVVLTKGLLSRPIVLWQLHVWPSYCRDSSSIAFLRSYHFFASYHLL